MEERNTLQKEIIYQTLCGMSCHPTAGMVYEQIHKQHPAISRSTVFRVLSRMAGEGKILRLEFTESRYDGQTCPHDHVRCRICGAVADIPRIQMAPPDDDAGFLLEDCTVIYRGLCPACRNSQSF